MFCIPLSVFLDFLELFLLKMLTSISCVFRRAEIWQWVGKQKILSWSTKGSDEYTELHKLVFTNLVESTSSCSAFFPWCVCDMVSLFGAFAGKDVVNSCIKSLYENSTEKIKDQKLSDWTVTDIVTLQTASNVLDYSHLNTESCKCSM